MRDSNGREICVGDRIIFKMEGCERTGIVEYDKRYRDGLSVLGMSFPYICDECEWIKIV